MDFVKYSAKTVNDAITQAALALGVSSEQLEIEVIDEGSNGFLGIGSRLAVIQAKKKFSLEGTAVDFLKDVFRTMNMEVEIDVVYDADEKTMDIDLKGDDMGILIGKRGQTLDSLQYLTSLVVNKYTEDYIRVKLDIENYRERRKETLETLARNIAYKVKRTRRPVSLEPMNPYERRIIHSALQNDRYVVTRSEGEEPFRHVVVSLKREQRNDRYEKGGYRRDYRNSYHSEEE
ncbi:RNA-binding cell elongation regulator Jag/EloR [Hominifimenecus microfluidus]|uniref:RNA-binding protein KhpB n=1 Tax=Hominifimenecus microfluidus TaxID=2885348 RepID=A0AAE3EDS8_9FIRM|nr:RNA-binding cell elongation regulator Jag/EloR [Hominifimenecus microfluidus]MCC2232130.1 protein jag [Hominifimenecus microfluidus]